MIISTKQIIITIAVLGIGIMSFSGFSTFGITYGQGFNSHIPTINLPDIPNLPHLPNFPNPPNQPPGCTCPPGVVCAQIKC